MQERVVQLKCRNDLKENMNAHMKLQSMSAVGIPETFFLINTTKDAPDFFSSAFSRMGWSDGASMKELRLIVVDITGLLIYGSQYVAHQSCFASAYTFL